MSSNRMSPIIFKIEQSKEIQQPLHSPLMLLTHLKIMSELVFFPCLTERDRNKMHRDRMNLSQVRILILLKQNNMDSTKIKKQILRKI